MKTETSKSRPALLHFHASAETLAWLRDQVEGTEVASTPKLSALLLSGLDILDAELVDAREMRDTGKPGNLVPVTLQVNPFQVGRIFRMAGSFRLTQAHLCYIALELGVDHWRGIKDV
jgi:hypothetical protein